MDLATRASDSAIAEEEHNVIQMRQTDPGGWSTLTTAKKGIEKSWGVIDLMPIIHIRTSSSEGKTANIYRLGKQRLRHLLYVI